MKGVLFLPLSVVLAVWWPRVSAAQPLEADPQIERETASALAPAAEPVAAPEFASAGQPASPELAPASQPASPAVRGPELFYDLLAAHGDWLETDRFGYVWRPQRSIVDPEWRPYADGRWQWTDYGWTWQSAEPYGWAVYHYGRWFRDRAAGWLWVPGREWSPGWVSWRAKGSEFVGWAPLPPADVEGRAYGWTVDRELRIAPASYVFLSARHFDEPTYLYKFEDRNRGMEMLRSSRNVTRLEPRPGMAVHPMVAGGPDPAMISTFIRNDRDNPDLHPAPLLKLTFGDVAPAEHLADAAGEKSMMLYAPNLEKGSGAAPAKVAQGKVRLAQRDHAWSEVSPEHAAEWQTLLAREAAQAAAHARAIQQRAQQPARVAIAPAPQPPPVRVNTSAPPPARRNPLNPASLQPAGGLFQRR